MHPPEREDWIVEARLADGHSTFRLKPLLYYLGRKHRHQRSIMRQRRHLGFTLSRRQYRNMRQWMDRHPEATMDDLTPVITIAYRRINKPERDEQRYLHCTACGKESKYHGGRKRCQHCKSITLQLRHRSLIAVA